MSERTAAVNALDIAYSIYVRRSHEDNQGCVSCWTCGKRVSDYKELQAGHFQTRVKYSTRWQYDMVDGKPLTINCKPQCAGCNISNGGKQYEFGIRLDEVYGAGTAMRMIQESNVIRKFTTKELRELCAFFKQLNKAW